MSYDFKVGPAEQYQHDPFEKNVTYNVATMLKRAGFHPIILNGRTAVELRPVVRHAWQLLIDQPEYFKKFDPENGWGSFNGVRDFISDLDTYLTTAPDDYVLRVT